MSSSLQLTNFARPRLLTAHHPLVSIRHEAGAAKEARDALARFHGLHGEILAHRFGDGVHVLAALETLLGQHLDLGASV